MNIQHKLTLGWSFRNPMIFFFPLNRILSLNAFGIIKKLDNLPMKLFKLPNVAPITRMIITMTKWTRICDINECLHNWNYLFSLSVVIFLLVGVMDPSRYLKYLLSSEDLHIFIKLFNISNLTILKRIYKIKKNSYLLAL